MGESQNKKTTTLVLVGKTGNGKSSTGNSILGYRAFKPSGSFTSCTKKCEMKSVLRKDGRELNVVDTPGLFDTETPQQDVIKEIKKCMDLARDGLHGILFVLSLGRFTPEEASVLNCLQIVFGPEITNHMLLVFTHGDDLEDGEETFEQRLDMAPKKLKDLIHRCNNRKVLFDNKTKLPQEKEKQLNELLMNVDNIVSKNGTYSNELFRKFQEMAISYYNKEEMLVQIDEMIKNKVDLAKAEMEKQLASEQEARRQAEKKVQELKGELDQVKARPPPPGPPGPQGEQGPQGPPGWCTVL